MKKVLSIILSVVMVLSSLTFVMAADDIKITINGEAKSFDVMPQIIDGRTLVPMRAIFEALGATVGWDDATKTATGKTASTEVSLTIDKKDAKVNGATKTLDVPAQIIEGRTMVPARFVAESLGCKVDWDGNTKTVIITAEAAAQKDAKLPEGGTVVASQDDLLAVANGKSLKNNGGVFVAEIATKGSTDTAITATFKTDLTGKIKKGDVCVATFKARATKGTGYAKVFVQASKENGFVKTLFARTSYGSDWTDCYLPFVGIDKDMAQAGIRFAGEAHTTEIKDFKIINYGTSVKPETLPSTHYQDGANFNIYGATYKAPGATDTKPQETTTPSTPGDWTKMTVVNFEDGKVTPSTGANFWAVKKDGANANSKQKVVSWTDAGISKPNTTDDFGSKLIKLDINAGEKGDYKGGIVMGRINDIPANVAPYEAGAKYKVSVWAYLAETLNGGNTAKATLTVYSAKETNGFGKGATVELKKGEWKKIELEIQAAAKNVGQTTGVRFSFTGDPTVMYMDNVLFEKNGSFTPVAAETKKETAPTATGGEKILDATLPQSGTVIASQKDFATCANGNTIKSANDVVTINVASKGANDRSVEALSKTSLSGLIKKGNVYMLTFKARLVSGEPYIKAFIQADTAGGFSKPIFAATSYGKEWTTCYMPFVGIDKDMNGGWGFRLGGAAHVSEIKDLQIIDYGTSVKVTDLPHTYIVVGNTSVNGIKLQ